MDDQLRGQYKATDLNWVITVPAIWKARARRMMREAAYMVRVDLFFNIPAITMYIGWSDF